MDRLTISFAGMEDVRRRLFLLGKDAPRAIVRSLNRTLQATQTRALRELAADTGLTQKVIRRSLAAQRATFGRQEALLQVTGRRIPLVAFGARGPEPSRGRGRGVTHRLRDGTSPIKDAFFATMQSGHRGVFKRIGTAERRSRGAWSKNLPIVELHGPSLPGVVSKPELLEPMLAFSRETLRKQVDHEINFLASQGRPAPAGGS
jgi:hypothetical protein